MITISPAEQAAWQSGLPKNLTLNFPFSEALTNDDIYMESAQLEQSICEESNLTFGMVYSSCFSVRIFDNGISYTGQRVLPQLSVTDGNVTFTRSLGNYTVKSDKLTSDKLYRDLVCYDYLTDVLPVSFVQWHNSRPATFTMKQYRDAFFQQIQLTQKSITLPNDNVQLKRFTVTELTGADILACILQLNGAFGYIDYDGEFRYVLPKTTVDYTIDDNSFVQGSLVYEDEPIKPITGVKILGYSDDYGDEGSYSVADASAGNDTGNVLVIENNNLIQSCPIATRQTLCTNLYNSLKNYTYYPTSVELPVYIGMEPGDVFKIETDRKDITFPFFKRTLKGITSLMDTVEAEGEPDLDQNNNSVTTGVSSTSMAINQVRESVAELLAQKASIEAQDAAIAATIAANSALLELSIVQDVTGTLNWIREYGDYVLTNDTQVMPQKIYFEKDGNSYVPIASPDPGANPHALGWYVLDVSDSQADFIMAHLAVTEAGLWVLPMGALSPHYLVDSDENQLVDSNDDSLVDWSKDPESAPGYKVLLANDGMSIYDDQGAVVAKYGADTTIGNALGNNVHITNNGVFLRYAQTILASFSRNNGIILGEEQDIHIGNVEEGSMIDAFEVGSHLTFTLSHSLNAITNIFAQCKNSTTGEFVGNVPLTASDYSVSGDNITITNPLASDNNLIPEELVVWYTTNDIITQLSIGKNADIDDARNFPLVIGNNNETLDPSNTFAVNWSGQIYAQGHRLPIGYVVTADTNFDTTMTAGIDNFTNYARLGLPRGVYIISARFGLTPSSSSTGCIGLRICKDERNSAHVIHAQRQLGNVGTSYYGEISTSCIVNVTSNTLFYAIASSHYAGTVSARTFKAVCIS